MANGGGPCSMEEGVLQILSTAIHLRVVYTGECNVVYSGYL